MDQLIKNNVNSYTELFKNNSVEEAFIFGSVTTDKFNTHSDIDFIINFKEISDPVELGEKWWNIYYGLKDIFKRNIDIVSEDILTNPFFIKEIQKTKLRIYG